MNLKQKIALRIGVTIIGLIVILMIFLKRLGITGTAGVISYAFASLATLYVVITERPKIEEEYEKDNYYSKEGPAFLKILAIWFVFGIFDSALWYAEMQGRFIAFIEALVSKGFVYGVGGIGGVVIGYLVGKRFYERKLKHRADFMKSTGEFTQIVGSELYVAILIAALFLIAITIIANFIPIIGPCLERMNELEHELEPDYNPYEYEPYYSNLFSPATLQPASSYHCSNYAIVSITYISHFIQH